MDRKIDKKQKRFKINLSINDFMNQVIINAEKKLLIDKNKEIFIDKKTSKNSQKKSV